MAMYDWNGDGKKDGFDNYVDYEIYEKNSKDGKKQTSSGLSTLGALGCLAGGLVVTTLLFSSTDIDNVPGLLLMAVWIAVSFVIAAIANALKK